MHQIRTFNNYHLKSDVYDKFIILTCYLKHIVVIALLAGTENCQNPQGDLAASLNLHSPCVLSSAHTRIWDPRRQIVIFAENTYVKE